MDWQRVIEGTNPWPRLLGCSPFFSKSTSHYIAKQLLVTTERIDIRSLDEWHTGKNTRHIIWCEWDHFKNKQKHLAERGPQLGKPSLVLRCQQFLVGQEGINRIGELRFDHLSAAWTRSDWAFERLRTGQYPLHNDANIVSGISVETQINKRYLMVGPQINRDGFLGPGIDCVAEVKRPDEVHRIQHL